LDHTPNDRGRERTVGRARKRSFVKRRFDPVNGVAASNALHVTTTPPNHISCIHSYLYTCPAPFSAPVNPQPCPPTCSRTRTHKPSPTAPSPSPSSAPTHQALPPRHITRRVAPLSKAMSAVVPAAMRAGAWATWAAWAAWGIWGTWGTWDPWDPCRARDWGA
jgi:hypothetical protein